MTFTEIVNYRRSIRSYQQIPIDIGKVKKCLELASLSPNSSNMQLWEFYHITGETTLKALAKACLGQSAATSAQQMVVFVTRRDLFKQRAKNILEMETKNIMATSSEERQAKRIKDRKLYYGKVIPFIYQNCLGLMGLLRKLIVNIVGLSRPIVYQVSESDVRIVVHKSCALAAQTFMLAMAEEQYDTCPMEGFDSKMVKKILNLPYGAEVNMVVSCGIRADTGVWGERMRVPFEEVYKVK